MDTRSVWPRRPAFSASTFANWNLWNVPGDLLDRNLGAFHSLLFGLAPNLREMNERVEPLDSTEQSKVARHLPLVPWDPGRLDTTQKVRRRLSKLAYLAPGRHCISSDERHKERVDLTEEPCCKVCRYSTRRSSSEAWLMLAPSTVSSNSTSGSSKTERARDTQITSQLRMTFSIHCLHCEISNPTVLSRYLFWRRFFTDTESASVVFPHHGSPAPRIPHI